MGHNLTIKSAVRLGMENGATLYDVAIERNDLLTMKTQMRIRPKVGTAPSDSSRCNTALKIDPLFPGIHHKAPIPQKSRQRQPQLACQLHRKA